MQVLSITGITVSCLFIFFILSKRKRKNLDYLLALINLLTLLFLVLDILVQEKLTPVRFFLQTIIPYFLYFFFVLFALETLQEKLYQHGRWVLFFAPTLLSTAYIAADLFVLNSYNPLALQLLYDHPPLIYHFIYKGNQVWFIIALLWLLRSLKKHSIEIKNTFSFTDPIHLDWLRNSAWLFLAISLVSLLTFLISNFNLLPIDIKTAYALVSACIVLSIYYTSYNGIRQYSIAEYYGTLSQHNNQLSEGAEDLSKKYKSSSLTLPEQETIYQNLLSLFAQRQLYLEPKLQLQQVADELKISTHSLSQTINSLTGKPFYDFVNGYRVKHLQKLLQDSGNKKFTILGLGLESGFNSKASLNRVFKEETGLSPKEYQARQFLKIN